MRGHQPPSAVVAIALALLFAMGGALLPSGRAVAAGEDQFRAYWVDAFGEGIFTPPRVDKLVAEAKAGNFNALVVQVGRRGDCFCNNASMPRTDRPAIAPLPYDPLQTLIDRRTPRASRSMPGSSPPPSGTARPATRPDPRLQHPRPSKTGADNWLMTRSDGATAPAPIIYSTPAPGAADYIDSMYTSVVKNYDVDGINFDRVRYPDCQRLRPQVTAGATTRSPSRDSSGHRPQRPPRATDPQWSTVAARPDHEHRPPRLPRGVTPSGPTS